MRNLAWLTLLTVLLAHAGGCAFPAHMQGTSWLERMRPAPPADPNLITIETALIERPLGDAYLCRELWQDTDELFAGLERRELLKENGLRVGQLIGPPPAGFQALLLSTRYNSNPSHLTVPSGKTIPQQVGPVLPSCSFDLVREAGKLELEVAQARFGFDVTATLAANYRTRLVFTPKVETGENLLPFQASPEQGSWVFCIERPSRKFAELAWEVTLIPGQYLVIGCRPEYDNTFGHCAFVQQDGPAPLQRLLVIRTNRATSADSELMGDESARSGTAKSLAALAGGR